MIKLCLYIFKYVLFACGLCASWVLAQSQSLMLTSTASSDIAFEAVPVVVGLEHPWSIAFLLRDEGLLITERPGRLRCFCNGRLSQPLSGVPEVAIGGQGGLFDVVLDPQFADNRFIYLSYAKPVGNKRTTAIAKARLREDYTGLEGIEDIFIAVPALSSTRHFGGRIVFDNQKMLYASIGDRGDSRLVQSLNNHLGTVIRIQSDGSVPFDNPFVGSDNAKVEIFTYGHRNPQGMIVTPHNQIWVHEHGPKGGDEINILTKGANYGWPVITYGKSYAGFVIGEGTHKKGMQQPLWYWTPSIAPSGMAMYTGDIFPAWQGNLLVGALKFRYIERLTIDNATVIKRQAILRDVIGRVRDIRVRQDGQIFVVNDEPQAGVYMLRAIDAIN